MMPTNCNQKGCNEPAAFRYTWPGQNEAGICLIHAEKLIAVAAAMGFHVQLIPVFPQAVVSDAEKGHP
jgi:hypothetical protein